MNTYNEFRVCCLEEIEKAIGFCESVFYLNWKYGQEMTKKRREKI